jgi:hypothetical protein
MTDDLQAPLGGSHAPNTGDAPGSLGKAPEPTPPVTSTVIFVPPPQLQTVIPPPERARHEAGHTVMAWEEGLRITGVMLTGDSGLGETHVPDIWSTSTNDFVRYMLAGGVATARWRGAEYNQSRTFGDSCDYKRIEERLAMDKIGAADWSTLIDRWAKEVERVLQTHHDLVERVAVELLQSEHLPEAVVVQLLGPSPAPRCCL